MKVLHVITSMHTGGAEKLVVEFVPRLQKKGHEVAVAVFNGEDTPFMKELMKSGCRIYRLSNKASYYNPSYIFKLIKIIRNYDVIHTHNSSPQLFVAISNLFCRRKIITTEHNTSNRRRNIVGFHCIDKWMYRQYHRVVCISDKAYDNLITYLKYEEAPSKYLTIYNGVDVDYFFRAKPIVEMKTNKFAILMVAAFRKQKDHDTLVKSMQYLPADKFELWLAGDGERFLEVNKLVKRMGLERQVIFLRNRNDIPSLLKTADVIVMSTHYEGLSLSNIEGMSVGKPFVATDVDGVHEVTVNAGILVPHQDAKIFADAIQKLSVDRKYYNQVATACYERAKQFDISKTVEQYDQVYQSLFKDERN